MDEIIQVQVISERDGGEGNLEWASTMEECRRELSCVCQKMAQVVGWQFGRPCRPHAPKPGEQRQHLENVGVLQHYQKALPQCPLLLQYCSNTLQWALPQ